MRILKMLLVLAIGMHALLYALQNLANINEAHGALAYVVSGADHQAYPHTLFFHTASPAFTWAAMVAVLIGEFSVGAFGLKGAWDMFAARNGTAEEFRAAKKAGLWAAGLALLYVGLAVVLGLIWPLVFLPIPLLAMNLVFIPMEEANAREAFGEDYLAYCRKVRRWL